MKLTAEMIREAEAHLPLSRNKLPPDRWAWMADFLNAALSDPGKICPCCRTTRDGEIMDHLPAPIPPSVPRESIGKLLSDAMEQAVKNGANSVSMPDDLVEIAGWLCDIPPTPPSVPDTTTLEMLALMFDAYENGTPCYEDPEDCAGYIGPAFRLSDEDFNSIADHLNKHAPIRKTDWVQESVIDGTLSIRYLGWHRADVMRAEIERLRAELDDINVADLQAEIEVLKESLHAAYLVGHHNALEKDEALLRQALDALDNHGSPWLGHDLVYLAAMDALKDRLK